MWSTSEVSFEEPGTWSTSLKKFRHPKTSTTSQVSLKEEPHCVISGCSAVPFYFLPDDRWNTTLERSTDASCHSTYDDQKKEDDPNQDGDGSPNPRTLPVLSEAI